MSFFPTKKGAGDGALPYIEASADISYCARYRYLLTRTWSNGTSRVVFVMLNPSTADATADDPTIKRCVGYAKAWGYDGLLVINLFAYRAASPRALLYKARSVVIGDNIRYWDSVLQKHADYKIVCGWGAHGVLYEQDVFFWTHARLWQAPLHALRLTKNGSPAHPLYLPTNLKPIPYANAP